MVALSCIEKNCWKNWGFTATFNDRIRSIRVRTLPGLVCWVKLPRDSAAAEDAAGIFQGSNLAGKPRSLELSKSWAKLV